MVVEWWTAGVRGRGVSLERKKGTNLTGSTPNLTSLNCSPQEQRWDDARLKVNSKLYLKDGGNLWMMRIWENMRN